MSKTIIRETPFQLPGGADQEYRHAIPFEYTKHDKRIVAIVRLSNPAASFSFQSGLSNQT